MSVTGYLWRPQAEPHVTTVSSLLLFVSLYFPMSLFSSLDVMLQSNTFSFHRWMRSRKHSFISIDPFSKSNGTQKRLKPSLYAYKNPQKGFFQKVGGNIFRIFLQKPVLFSLLSLVFLTQKSFFVEVHYQDRCVCQMFVIY